MAAQSTGSVKVLVQPPNDSFEAIATARQGLAHRIGGGRGLTFALRPLLGGRTGGIAAGLLRAGLLPPPHEALRLDGCLLPQPLLEDPAALALTQAGQLPVDLHRDLRPPGSVHENQHGLFVTLGGAPRSACSMFTRTDCTSGGA